MLFAKRIFVITYLALLYFLLPDACLFAQQDDKQMHKAAIFVENRAGRQFDNKIAVFEDFITSRVTEKGFSVISREVVTDSLKSYSPGTAKENRLNTLLSNNTSALRLSQMMNADYLIVASISSFGTEKKKFKGYGLETVNLVTNLRASFKILEGSQGSTLAADTILASKSERFTERSTVEDNDMINMLLDEAACRIAESLGNKHIAPPSPKPDLAEITIACGMQDLAQLPISVPDVIVKEDNTMVVQNSNLEVHVLDVTVELNGVVIGSAPDVFKAPPGLNKIRLTREGFRDWERTINVYNGQRLKVALQMNEAGYARWKDNTAFLHHLKNGEKLTDANVELIKGGAQMLRQSGFKIDAKADITGDIKSIFKLFW